MPGETKLEILLKSMKPILRDGEFVFCTLSFQHLEELELKPIGWFQEDEGITVIVQRQQAESLSLQYSYPVDNQYSQVVEIVTGTIASQAFPKVIIIHLSNLLLF